jgi:hypothetical protein
MESCCKCFGCCCADITNAYDIIIQDDINDIHFTAKEESSCIGRACCNPNHGLVLHVTDKANNEVLTIDRPFKSNTFPYHSISLSLPHNILS